MLQLWPVPMQLASREAAARSVSELTLRICSSRSRRVSSSTSSGSASPSSEATASSSPLFPSSSPLVVAGAGVAHGSVRGHSSLPSAYHFSLLKSHGPWPSSRGQSGYFCSRASRMLRTRSLVAPSSNWRSQNDVHLSDGQQLSPPGLVASTSSRDTQPASSKLHVQFRAPVGSPSHRPLNGSEYQMPPGAGVLKSGKGYMSQKLLQPGLKPNVS
mmetsp:Transcript_72652/g.189518  ORF Transcript_72652/g.189518 Transcript_72652/m.189518 type:complete len:215 (-) Transcript_72652:838-1482(-)